MDLTVLATPVYFGSMAVEHAVLRRRAEQVGPGAADYTRPDTLASLAMGVGSLLVPLQVAVLRRLVPGRTRAGTVLVGVTVASALATTLADRRRRGPAPCPSGRNRPAAGTASAGPAAPPDPGSAVVPGGAGGDGPAGAPVGALDELCRRVAAVGGLTAVGGGALALMATAQHLTATDRQWARGRRRDLGTGPLAWAVALVGWDLAYYANHRLMHEVRALWAVHVVHHSSERLNLSTALRQPVAGGLGVWVPYGGLARLGVRPALIQHARAIDLLYQFWIHTDTIGRLGPAEEILNTPSHHRVHHGSNQRYLDRNHGGILIVWDRLFGTFQRELPDDPPVYGLTRNIKTFNPVRIVLHEYRDMARDIARSTSWRDRLSFVLRGPGWATRRRAELTARSGEATGGGGGRA